MCSHGQHAQHYVYAGTATKQRLAQQECVMQAAIGPLLVALLFTETTHCVEGKQQRQVVDAVIDQRFTLQHTTKRLPNHPSHLHYMPSSHPVHACVHWDKLQLLPAAIAGDNPWMKMPQTHDTKHSGMFLEQLQATPPLPHPC